MIVAVALGGCYLPVRFDAEVEISRYGAYIMIFDGYLVDVPLYDGLRKRKISPAEERKKAERIKTDLTRDSATKEFNYLKQGHFKVHWRKAGDLLRAKMVTFLRRNEKFLIISYVKTTGLVSVQSNPIDRKTARRLMQAGLDMQGQLRVRTDAKVAGHNAQRVMTDKTTGKTVYIWNIKSILDPPPKISIVLR